MELSGLPACLDRSICFQDTISDTNWNGVMRKKGRKEEENKVEKEYFVDPYYECIMDMIGNDKLFY